MDQYIRYHKKPYAKYLDVQSFNDKYGTNIKEVEDYDLYFMYTFYVAREKHGPDDFLQVNFMNHDQFVEYMATEKSKGTAATTKKSWFGGLGKMIGKSAIGKAISGAAGVVGQYAKDKLDAAKNIAGDIASSVTKKKKGDKKKSWIC